MSNNIENAKIFDDIYHLRDHLKALRKIGNPKELYRKGISKKDLSRVVMTSGGFDPLHLGHLQCIQKSAIIANTGILIVIVNGDDFLINKKGYAFMDLNTRIQIIASIRGVDYVVPWNSKKDMTVCKPIEILQPTFFTKGGDRDSKQNVPEFEICEKVGCEVLFRIGGEKIQSSSELITRAEKKMKKKKK